MYINYVSEGWTKNQNLNILDALHKVAANCGEKYLKFMKPFRPQQPLDKKGMNIVAHGLGTVIASQLGMAIANDGVFYVKNYFGEYAACNFCLKLSVFAFLCSEQNLRKLQSSHASCIPMNKAC